MIKKQRVTKYISILSVSLGIIIVTLFSNTQDIKAYSSNTSPVTIESHMGEITTTHIEVVITLNFADYYSGYITFTIYNRSSQPVSYYALNAKLTNMTNTGFRTEVNQTKYAEVHIFYQTESLQQACYNAGLIASNTFGLFTTYLNTNWKSTTDVRNSTWSSSTLYVDNPVDDLLTEVTSIDTNISDIESYISTLTGDVQTISTQLSTLINSINEFQTYDIQPYQYPAFILFDILADLDYSNDLTLPIYHMPASSSFTWNSYIKLDSNDIYFVYYMKLSSINNFTYTTYSGHSINKTRNFISETSTYRLYYDILPGGTSTEYLTPTSSSAYDIAPIYLGSLNQMPTIIREILNIETVDQNLFRQIINKLTDVINAISNQNVTIENNQEINNVVNNKNTTITNITNNHNTVNNITNNFALDFDSANNAITFDTNIITNLTDTATFWNGKLGEVEVALGNFQYPVVLGFILLAVLALIGV